MAALEFPRNKSARGASDMPAMLGFLRIAVAIFFAVHAARHGRNNYWGEQARKTPVSTPP